MATRKLTEQRPRTVGLVLAGGRSSRMGTDKVMMQLGGTPLIGRVVAALDGLDSVRVVGGSDDSIADLGVGWIPDDFPGEGPLGALVTGMRACDEDIIVMAACDLPHLRPATVDALVGELVRSGADVAVPLIGGALQWHVGAWRNWSHDAVGSLFKAGVRSLHRAGNALRLTAVVFADHGEFVDLDTPDDVRREFPE